MRIGTYNVLGLTGYPRSEASKVIGDRLSETAAKHFSNVFDQLNCDILGLQEGVPFPQIQRIAHAMKMNLATFPSPVAWPGHLLTRFQILGSRTFSHTTPTASSDALSRCAGAALLKLDDGSKIWIVVIHLHPGDRDLRDREADLLQIQIKTLFDQTDQIALVGDFNCEIDEKIHDHLRAMNFANAMEIVGGGVQATMDTVGIHTHYIDHIYVSAVLMPKLKSAEVIRSDGFRHDGPQVEGLWVHSDHLPVIADLDA